MSSTDGVARIYKGQVKRQCLAQRTFFHITKNHQNINFLYTLLILTPVTRSATALTAQKSVQASRGSLGSSFSSRITVLSPSEQRTPSIGKGGFKRKRNDQVEVGLELSIFVLVLTSNVRTHLAWSQPFTFRSF